MAVILITPFFSNNVYAQKIHDNDSIVENLHSPKKATYMSMVPGLGQIYNKKYWKLPIVYAGFGATGYFAFWNRGEYKKYNTAYICLDQNGDECTNPLAEKYDLDQLESLRDYYRRNMELSFIFMGVWYVLQMLDASVDAHLYYWNVDDDISVRIDPVIQQSIMNIPQSFPQSPINSNGLKITVAF